MARIIEPVTTDTFMPYHFTISYDKGFGDVVIWLRQRAAADPLWALTDGSYGPLYAIAAGSEQTAHWQQQQFNAGRGVAEGVALIEFFNEASTLRIELECGEAERDEVATILTEMLKKFPNFVVYDEDAGQDITEEVRRDPHSLFKMAVSS